MTIKQLRELFISATEIIIMSTDEENLVSVTLNNLLLGIASFAEIPILIKHVQAVKENQIVVEVDMPIEVLTAWKNYSDDSYRRGFKWKD